MFKRPLNFGVCPAHFFSRKTDEAKVFHTAGEHVETNAEKQEASEFKAEQAFDPKKEWNQQILGLVKTAMADEKYQSYIDIDFLRYIETGNDFQKFQAERQNVRTLKLEHGVIICLDDDGRKIAQFDIAPAIQKILDKWKDHDCELCYRSSRRRRLETARSMGRSDTILRILAQAEAKKKKASEDEQRKIIEAPRPPPIDPQEQEAQERHQEVMAKGRAKRESILRSVTQMKQKQYEVEVDIDPKIQNDDLKTFEEHWPFMNFSKDIDDLFQHDADPKEGYQVNPFFRQKWNRERLLKLIQKSDNAKLYFSEVAEEIYTDRFEEFKKELKDAKVSDEVCDMLSDNLLESYKKFSKIYADIKDITKAEDIPDKYRKIFKFRTQIKEVVQILGDYIAYGNKLVNLVGQLRYNPGEVTMTREATMFEYDPKLTKPSDKVKRALHALFKDGVDSPREYSSELKYLFRPDKSARPITFQDLNGRTATLRTDEGLDQSPDTAYKLALEQIGEPEKSQDGKWVERVTEDDAKNHLNNLLQLGIAAYTAGPKKRGIKEVMDDLTKAGVELSPGEKFRFSGDLRKDTQNLFTVLALKNLDDLYKKDSEKAKLIAQERTKFIRLGSVVYQKNAFHKQERKQAERERLAAEKAAGIKLSPEAADSIIAELRKSGRFNEEQLAKLKGALIGGAVVVLPSHGGAFNIHYEFDNGVTIDLTGTFPQWESFAAGATVGQKFDAGNDITISINATAGYSFAKNTSGGLMGGGGLSITKKLERVDVSVVGGGGVLLGPMIPVGFTGLGLNWAKTQERYEKTLSKKEVETGIAELEKSSDIYAEVKNNPSKYPAITRIYDQIDNIPNLDEASKRDMFNSAYSMFKTGIQGEAIDDSAKDWYEKFIPTGAGLGIVWVGPVPVPYAYLEFNLWSRNLVYRIATSVERAEKISEAEATEKILANYNKANTKVETKTLATTGELTLDPRTGKLVLKSIKGGEIDFSHLDKLTQFTDTLSRDAKIFVEQDKNGLLRLKPQEAYGNVEVYVDPELKDKVIVVTKPGDAHLYLSVKKGEQIFFKREDVTFPFEERGAVERTVITISANPHVDTETIQKQSTWHIDRTPTTTWVKRPHAGYGIPETQKPQENIKTNKEYEEWWKKEDNRTNRLEFVDVNEYKQEYKKLTGAVTLAQGRESADAVIRANIREKIEKLTKDKKFLNHFRALTTERFDLKNPRNKPPVGDWDIDFPKLVRDLKTKLNAPDLNEYETNAAIIALLIASFQNIHKKSPEKAKEEYLKFLESFERPMLTAIFEQYYKDYPDKDKKTADAVNYIIEQLKEVDVTAAGEKVLESTLFGTLVGMNRITGIRRLYNYNETNPQWGVVGRKTLDVTKKDVSGEVADFWVNKLSPYVSGLEVDIRNKDAIYENMNSPLALKLAPLVAVIFNPEEMEDLTEYYKKTKREAQITNDNKDVIKKILGWCDKIRLAELNGEREVKLDENFKILIDLKVSMGIYKECGNITGLVNETFALVHEEQKKIYYYAGLGEGIIDVEHKYEQVDFYIMAGIAVPLPREQRVTRPEKIPHKRIPREIPPEETPTEHIPPETPPPEIPTAEEITVEPADAPGIHEVAGNFDEPRSPSGPTTYGGSEE